MKFMNLTIRKRRPTMKISGKKGIAVILKIILVMQNFIQKMVN